VRRAKIRIEQYAGFGREIETQLSADAATTPVLENLTRTAVRLKQITSVDQELAGANEKAARLATAILALIDDEDPVERLEPLSAGLHRLGASQSGTLAGCRLLVRWLREQARTLAHGQSSAAGAASEVRARCERLLKRD
jgi:hypothetical protein